MELLYTYIESYGSFKNVNFNFSPRYKFKYNSCKLKCSEVVKSSVDHFWGKRIENLSVIVGDNGAGKTTLLRCIMDCISYGGVSANAKCFFVFLNKDKEGSNIIIYTYGMQIDVENIECSIEGLGKPKVFNNVNQKECSISQLKGNKIIYLNNALEKNDYLYAKYGQTLDLSIAGLIKDDYKSNLESKHIDESYNILINFFNSEIYRHIDFIYNYKNKDEIEIIPFELPDKLNISFADNKRHLKNISDELKKYGKEHSGKIKKEFDKKIDDFVYMIVNIRENSDLNDKDKWVAYMAESIVANSIREIAISPSVPFKRKKEFNSFIEAYDKLDKNKNILEICDDFFNIVAKNLKRNNSMYSGWVLPYADFIKWILQDYEKINFDFSKIGLALTYPPSFSVKIRKDEKKVFDKFFNKYQKICSSFYFLNFSWGLSSGQYNLLSNYSRMYTALKLNLNGEREEKVVNKFSYGEVECSNILLLIDEADLSYHPKWQSEYIYSLVNFLPSIYKNCDIQIILTTHSPIMLSDVPKSNVIYLRNGKNDSDSTHKETFGQNIYTLFNDAFYFGDVGDNHIIGRFSEDKIKRVRNSLNNLLKDASDKDNIENDNLSIEDMKSIIDLIGEPVIRSILEAKLEKIENKYKSENLTNVINYYDALSKEEKEKLIEHIIRQQENN